MITIFEFENSRALESDKAKLTSEKILPVDL